MDTTKPPSPVETPPPPSPPPPPPPPQPLPEEETEEPTHQPFLNTDHKHAFLKDAHNSRTSSAFDNFKKLLKDVAFASAKTNSLTSFQTSILQHHIDQLSPLLHTPDHPPYAAMIQEAIEQLNEEEGSCKEQISTFIRNNYKDLPWAHNGMLEHHLNILCKNSYLVQTEDGRYLLPNVAIEKSDASTALTSPSVGTSYNSFSSSSSSSGSEDISGVLGKRKFLPNKQKKARKRKRIRKSGRSVFGGRTKSSITRLGRPCKTDDLLTSSEEKESNEVESEAYGSTRQPSGGTTDSDNEFHERENQKQKESASGKDLPGREDEEEEAYKQIELLVGHTEDTTTKVQERSDIRKCEHGVNSRQVTPVQSPIAGKGNGKRRRGRPRKQLVFEETDIIPEDTAPNNETTGKAHQVQNLQDEVPKKRRGRPPKGSKKVEQKPPRKNNGSKKESKLQDPTEEGRELKRKRVPMPGRKPGRPRKNDLSRQVEMVQEQLQTITLQDMTEKSMEEEKDSKMIKI